MMTGLSVSQYGPYFFNFLAVYITLFFSGSEAFTSYAAALYGYVFFQLIFSLIMVPKVKAWYRQGEEFIIPTFGYDNEGVNEDLYTEEDVRDTDIKPAHPTGDFGNDDYSDPNYSGVEGQL
jgi:hypothetical protein